MSERALSEVLAIVTTTDERGVADAIAEAMVGRRLAACARISSGESVYRWKGEVCRAEEFVVEIKTTSVRREAVERAIAELHNYELPEILVFAVAGGSAGYLEWLRAESSAEEGL